MAKAQPIESGEDRIWRLLLMTGGIFAVVFLVLQLSDYWNDRGHGTMQKNDLTAAAASVAMLAIVGVIAGGRAMKKKQAAPAVPAPVARVKPAKKKKKPGAAYARRKRRS